MDGDGLGAGITQILVLGRITRAEAEQLRSASAEDERHVALLTLDGWYATQRIADAVAVGKMSQSKAAAALGRLAAGVDPKTIRHRLHPREPAAPSGQAKA